MFCLAMFIDSVMKSLPTRVRSGTIVNADHFSTNLCVVKMFVKLEWLRSPKIYLAAVALAAMGSLIPVMKFNYAYADPPPWAPAYGHRDRQYGDEGDRRDDGEYRDRHREHDDEDEGEDEGGDRSSRAENQAAYVPPYGIDRGTCNREEIGQILGGIAGATIGSTVGHGDGRTAAMVGGAILGVIVGGNIGRTMDDADQACVGQILEHDPDGRRVEWVDNDSGTRYYVTPSKPFKNRSGHYCRKYMTNAVSDGGRYKVYNTACRDSDGSWKRIN
jgi:surface antigen